MNDQLRPVVTTPVAPAVLAALTTHGRSPFAVREFAATLAAQRQRPIELVSQALGGTGPCGVVVTTDIGDSILFYDSSTTPLHARHVVAHELAHLALGHHERPTLQAVPDQDNPDRSDTSAGRASLNLPPDELRRLLFPDLPDGTITNMLRRGVYGDQDERDAELLATLLLLDTASTPSPRRFPNQPADLLADPDQHPRRSSTGRWSARRRQAIARRLHAALEPLWARLPHAAVADLEEFRVIGSPELTLYRRVVEIRDALLVLRPYTHPSIQAWVREQARRALLTARRTAIAIDAAELGSAIDLYNARQSPCPLPGPAPLVIPAANMFAEARALVQLDKMSGHPLVTAMVRRARPRQPGTGLVACHDPS